VLNGGANLSFLDLIALVIILFFSVRGWFKGIARELSAILGLFIGLGMSVRYSSAVGSFLKATFPSLSHFSLVVAFSLIFLGILIAFSIAGAFVSKFFKLLWLGWFDRGGGFILGLVEGLCILSLILWGIHLLPDAPVLKELKGESLSYKLFEMHGLPYLRRLIANLRWK